jgi:hypothetical protein
LLTTIGESPSFSARPAIFAGQAVSRKDLARLRIAPH